MTVKTENYYAQLEKDLADCRREDELIQRRTALLTAIIKIFRESMACETEEDVARISLKVAEELTGSAISFIGELNQKGTFDTTTLSTAGWNACKVPREEALQMLKNMPNRGINRVGLRDHSSWIINDPASHSNRVEKPEGHPKLTSFLGVPLHYMGGITGLIALANKETGYTTNDQHDVEALSVAFLEALNRRRAEKKINELNAELSHHLLQVEAANKELEAFSYSVSHDLRAPLRHITGFVELLNERDFAAMDEKSRHYLKVISESARKMGILIDDLLDFSRMGRSEMMKTKIDLKSLVREIVAEQEQNTHDREVIWEIAPLPVVMGDIAMIRQVLVNLIANALKFTRQRKEAKIEIGAISEHPDETIFYIKDNGVGFEMKYVDKLFGLFQRLHDPQEFEGIGIGLANVQRIILRHGGRIWAEGMPNKGAVFWFSLPNKQEG